jgi:hypothetical protein
MFRGDADRGFVFGGLLSTSQFIAVVLAPAAIVLWVIRRQRAQKMAPQKTTRTYA